MRENRAVKIADRSRLVGVEGGRLWISDIGPLASEKPPIVFIHGLLTSGREWWRLSERMASEGGHRCIAIDLLGCGNSDRPGSHRSGGYSITWLARTVADLLDTLALTSVVLISHNWGAAVATKVVGSCIDRVAGLVLISPLCISATVYESMALPRWSKFMPRAGLGPRVFRMLFRRADLRSYLRRSLCTPELLDDDDVAIYWDHLRREGGLETLRCFLVQLGDTRNPARRGDSYGGTESPCLVVWGDRDEINPTWFPDQLVDTIRGGTGGDVDVVTVAGSGHAPQRERPQALYEILESWMSRRLRENRPIDPSHPC